MLCQKCSAVKNPIICGLDDEYKPSEPPEGSSAGKRGDRRTYS